MGKCIDLIGQKFGRLTVIKRVDNRGTQPAWFCRCDCGCEVIVLGSNLKAGKTQSCGCLHREKGGAPVIHGFTHTKLYKVWVGIKTRCNNKKNKDYKNYGFRGIKICDEWESNFVNFYDWATTNGYKQGLTIDRIDVNGDYEPNNCRWITRQEQNYNRRNNIKITYNCETHCLKEWAKILNINYASLLSKIKQGYDAKKIFADNLKIY